MDPTSIIPDKTSNQAKLFLFATISNGFGNGIFNVFDRPSLESILFFLNTSLVIKPLDLESHLHNT